MLCPMLCDMTTHIVGADPTTDPRTLLDAATLLSADAADAREDGDHSAAGIYREKERALLKRAEVAALVVIGEALESIADDLSRIGLAR